MAYELVGAPTGGGRLWVITTGGRFTRETPGVRELAGALAVAGDQALIWDKPNSGASDVSFAGASEAELHADTLAGLLGHLDLGPAVLTGATVGARVALLTAARHPEVAARAWRCGGSAAGRWA